MEMVPVSDESAFHEYVLTQKGLDLFPVVTALWQWGEKYFFEAGESHPVLRDRLTKEADPKTGSARGRWPPFAPYRHDPGAAGLNTAWMAPGFSE